MDDISTSNAPADFIPNDQFRPDEVAQPPAQAEQSNTPDFIPNDQFVADEEKHSSLGEQLKTGAEGLAEGVVGPLAPLIEKGLGVRSRDILERREENPISHGVGQALGLGASLFYGVGEGAIAAKVGLGAKEAIGLGKAESFLGKAGGEAIDQAAQMALIQGSDEVSKMIINDPNATAENAMANVGLSTALGGITGAAIGSIAPLWKASGVGDKLGKTVEDFRSRIAFRQENPNMVDAVSKEFTGLKSNVHDALDAMYSGEGGGLRGELIAKALPEVSEKATGKVQTQLQNISDSISDKIKMMSKDEVLSSHTKKLERELRLFQEKVTDPASNYASQYDAVNSLKQDLQAYGKNAYKLGAEESLFAKETASLASELKPMLEDTAVWGKAADVQKEINSLYGPYKNSVKDVTSKFMTKLDNQYVIDPAKVNTYVNGIGKPSQEIRQEAMKNYLDRTEKIIEKVNKTFTNKGLEAPIEPISTNVLRDTIGEKTAGASLADKLLDKEIDRVSGKVVGAGIGSALGSLVGHPGLGAIAGEHALGPTFSNVMGGLTKYLMQKNTSAVGFKSAIDYSMQAAKGQQSLNKAVTNMFKAGTQVLATNHAEPDQKSRDKLDKVITQMQTNPDRLTKTDNGHIGHYMPEHQTAMSAASVTAVQYLQSMKPHPFRSSPLDAPIEPSKVEMARYNRALDIAQQPAIVLQHIKAGTLQSSDIQDLNTMYPALYSQMASQINNQIANMQGAGATIPYKTRIGLSLFLGQPLDTSMLPSSITAAQPQQQGAQGPEGQPITKNKHNTSSMGKNIKSYQTPIQAAAADRSSRD